MNKLIYLIKDLLTNEYYSRSFSGTNRWFTNDITLAKVYSANTMSQVNQTLVRQQQLYSERNLIIVKAQITELGEFHA